MKSKVFKFFGNLVACFVLIFGAQLSCFAIDPSWDLNYKSRTIFNSLPEAMQVELNKMSDDMYQNKLHGVSDENNLKYFLKHITAYYISCVRDIKASVEDNPAAAQINKRNLVKLAYIVGFYSTGADKPPSNYTKVIINTRSLKNFTHSLDKTSVSRWLHRFEYSPKRSVTEEDSVIYEILNNIRDNIELKRWSVHFLTHNFRDTDFPLTTPLDHISKPFYLSRLADEIFPIPNKIKLYDTDNNLDKFLDSVKTSLNF